MSTRPQPRKPVALLMLTGFVLLTVTGLLLYFWPSRGFTLLAMHKGGWENVHFFVSLAFIAVGIGHIALNRKALSAYLGRRARRSHTPSSRA